MHVGVGPTIARYAEAGILGERWDRIVQHVDRSCAAQALGGWWYAINSNQMLALRCAKYNSTFDQVLTRHQQRLRKA